MVRKSFRPYIFTKSNVALINMLSKNKIKLIQSLNRKKNRDESGLFLVEGTKMVEEALRSDFQIETIIGTSEFLLQHINKKLEKTEIIEAESISIQKASLLQNPQDSLALIKIPANTNLPVPKEDNLILALDFIQDPGNLGTILRIADWFGIHTIICSENTVDVYNPKVVQASMGAIFRVKTHYTELTDFLSGSMNKQVPIYGTFLNGENIYQENLTPNGILVLGNEGNGISDPVSLLITKRLFIPSFSSMDNKPESLNVAVAAALCCSEFKRRS